MQQKHLSLHSLSLPHTPFCSLIIVVFLLFTLTSCHKTCTCIRYDGAAETFTSDEVDDHGVSCANMIYQAGVQYYSVCDWD